MKVCDICKQVGKKTFDVRIVVIKLEDKNGRSKEREIISIPVDLCDDDISHFNSRLGSFIHDFRKFKNPSESDVGSNESGMQEV